MKISKVRLQGFRTIERGFECELNDLTLLVGANNAGKSCIVKSLDAFFNNANSPEAFEPHIRVNPNSERQVRYTMMITLWFIGLPQTLEAKYAQYMINNQLPIRLRYRPKDKSINYLLFNNGRVTDGVSDGNRVSDVIKDVVEHILFKVIPETRDIQREFRTDLGEAYTLLKQVVIEQAQTKAIKAAKSLHDSIHKLIEGKLNKKINSLLGEIVPGHFFKIGGLEADSFAKALLNEVFKHYPVCATSRDGEDFSIEQMGAGFQNNVLIALHRAVAGLSDKNLILCIEEPEIHLDPNAQRQTYQEWLNMSVTPNELNQIIITSHSAFLVNEAQPHQIVVIRRDHENKTTAKQLTNDFLNLNNVIHLKTKVLSIKNADIFFSNGVILVEGDSDAVAIRGSFEKLLTEKPINKRKSLSGLGISVIDCGGKDSIAPLAKILKQLEIPYVMIYDKDFIQRVSKNNIEKEFSTNFNHEFDSISSFFDDFTKTKTNLLKLFKKGKQTGYPKELNAELKKNNILIIRTEHETDFIDSNTYKYVAEAVKYTIPTNESVATTVNNLKKQHKKQIKKATGTAMVLNKIPQSNHLPNVYKRLCSDILDVLKIR